MKPRILIPADVNLEEAELINQVHADYVPRPVVDAIQRAGGLPIVLPYSLNEDDVAAYMSMGDGVMFLGGPDVSPNLYHQRLGAHLGKTCFNRDEFEVMILNAAIQTHKTIFAVCRGAQLINVALGGDLYQDIDTQVDSAYIEHNQLIAGDLPAHDIKVASSSHLSDVVGTRLYVNSRHHQAIHKVGRGLHVTAKAPDGIVEAIESNKNDNIVAVQWHPENLADQQSEDQALFDDFIARTKLNMGTVTLSTSGLRSIS
ncbi:glutamine amidotransferase [Agrilactobacillus composti DSM 18527 = JCM 14202]|uniref:Glutamine amidotransferase n=1 Tax=Agrilactobacillus composti DSM 18527 = JCM 14202 TaxID=1423734 RepID=X0QNW7_9LACO|nr:gamma-glutamyl-gamma-aminobutyrate hydrolase family protein [Agrilactobacillus composti]KRM33256.1 glutamine amidotransferase [Agrilactobacillus composti DSM 18527 = JCM 14202]GAF40330.1 glutamine amidotransferase [Agrilactobacillus composti DSM 18527 = JCM 14202]